MEIALSSPLTLGYQMNPQHLALHPPSLNLKPIKLNSSLSVTATSNNNGRGRRRRRRRPTIGPFKITAASFKRAASFAMSLRDLLPHTTTDPLNLLLLHYGGSGGGGGGAGLPTGGSGGGDWFGKRRRRRFKFKGILGFLLVSISLASAIFEVGEKKKKADWELGVRVLVPAALGFKIRVWRNWVGLGLTMALGVVFCYALLRRSREKNRRPW